MGLKAFVFECSGCKREAVLPASDNGIPKRWGHLGSSAKVMLFCGGCLSRVFKALPPIKVLYTGRQ